MSPKTNERPHSKSLDHVSSVLTTTVGHVCSVKGLDDNSVVEQTHHEGLPNHQFCLRR